MTRRRMLWVLLVIGCADEGLPVSHGRGPAPFDPGEEYVPKVAPGAITNAITNPLYPAPVGARWVYEAHTDEGVERIEVKVLADAKTVAWGPTARVVRDTVYLNDSLVEDTWDWYGQDPDGHVWYLGEDTTEYENGVPKCHCGAWEAGVDGALPGVIMLAHPTAGDVYRQEYFANEAEDLAQVIRTDATVDVPAGSWTNCLETRDLSAIDPDIDSRKFYCPGVGTALEIEGDVRVELIEYAGL